MTSQDNTPARRYATIVADPPWPMPDSGKWTGKGGGWASYTGSVTKLPYSSMTVQQIADLPVGEIADRAAHLYVWTTNHFLEETYSIVRHWGFRAAQMLVWCKPPMGVGFGGAFTTTTEFVLFARRGQLPHRTRLDSSWWQWKRGPHSAKPDAFLDLVEQVSPGPYLEMFSRRARLGWDTWGDEALHGTSLMAAGGAA